MHNIYSMLHQRCVLTGMATHNESQTYDVMLSYSWEQKNIVHEICDRLKKRNIKVWIDKNQIISGNIFEKMADGVRNSRIIVPVISMDYKSSPNAQRELNAAAVQNKPMIPIRVEKKIPDETDSTELIIAGRRYFEFYNNEMENFDNFHQAIIEELFIKSLTDVVTTNNAQEISIWNYLVSAGLKIIFLHDLERKFSTIENLKSVLLQHPSLFWLGETQPSIWEVKPKVKAEFCLDYQDGTCNGQCNKLHLCRDSLLSPEFCESPCKHQRSHNIDDGHNKKVLQDAFPKVFCGDRNGKVKILRSSFPRLCKSFTEGKSCTKSCGYLHICPELIRGSCVGDCAQATLSQLPKKTTHNFVIEPNKSILNSFELSTSKSKVDRSRLLGNILINGAQQADNENVFCKGMDYRSRQLHSQSTSDISQKPSHTESVHRRSLTKATSSINLNDHANASTIKKSKISICHYYLNETCTKSGCRRLHVCKEYLARACKFSDCAFGLSHDLLDYHNKRITETIKACHSKKDAFEVVRSHLPQLCERYAVTGKCQWANECRGVHICKAVLLDTLCIDRCSKSHDFLDKHNEGIANKYSNLSEFKGSKWEKIRYFKANIIYTSQSSGKFASESICAEEPTKELFANKTGLKAHFNSLKDEAICYRYINGVCIEMSPCTLGLHPNHRLPFLWQYHREMKEWIDFSVHVSTELEKFFCDPNNGNDFSSSALTVDFSSENVASWEGSYRGNQVHIRRLSTMPAVYAKDESMVGLTQWEWYWESDTHWMKYSDTDQLDIEKAFLDDNTTDYTFQTNYKLHHRYLLNFETMEQQNLQYHTKRNVRRRPKFQDLDDIWFQKKMSQK